MEHPLWSECRIGFCHQRIGADGSRRCGADGDEDNRQSLSTIQVLSSKAASRHHGVIALLWRENHMGFEVEGTRILMPSLLTFQNITGEEQFYCMGV
jgi:hypothetical protein